jgi:hemerythrin
MQIVWDDRYSVGILELDEQHKVLINLINELNVIQSSEKDSLYEQKINDALNEVKNYTVLHFATEEILMRLFHYNFLDTHKFSHDKFTHIITEHHKYIMELMEQQKKDSDNKLEQEEIAQEINARISKVISFLQKWLLSHILKEDREYIEFFSKAQEKAQQKEGWLSFLK